jgi:alpha-galactosidase
MSIGKIVCLGGGSLYFRRALPDLIAHPDVAGSEIVIYDIDQEKADRMGGMARRLTSEAGVGIHIRATTDLTDAIDGADFALSSIGGSGAAIARTVSSSPVHRADIVIPKRYGIRQVIGDTCGPAGMMMGLRSIPIYVEIGREMEKRCPDVVFLNHSNPMAPICRAMHKYSSIKVIGICHGVQIGVARAARLLNVPPQELECTWIGTNHYYWFTRIRHKGRDLYQTLMQRISDGPTPQGTELSSQLSTIYGHSIVYTPDDHVIEFYPFLTQIPENQAELPYGLDESAASHGGNVRWEPRDQSDVEDDVRREFFLDYQKMLNEVTPSEQQDDPRTGEGIAAIVTAIAAGRRRLCIANIANQGAIPNLPSTAEVEVEAVTDSCGVRPLHMGEAPGALKGILEKRFAWHEAVADAAVTGDRNLALQALMLDEMAIAPEKAKPMLEELLEASKEFLPQFKK